jgi:hypothetical protein
MLPLLQFKRPARALYEALRAQPALFAEIVSYVYPAALSLRLPTKPNGDVLGQPLLLEYQGGTRQDNGIAVR